MEASSRFSNSVLGELLGGRPLYVCGRHRRGISARSEYQWRLDIEGVNLFDLRFEHPTALFSRWEFLVVWLGFGRHGTGRRLDVSNGYGGHEWKSGHHCLQ